MAALAWFGLVACGILSALGRSTNAPEEDSSCHRGASVFAADRELAGRLPGGGRARVYVQISRGEAVELLATPQTTVGRLKELLSDATGVPAAAQALVFGGELLSDDGALLSRFGVDSGALLRLACPPERAMVVSCGGRAAALVGRDDTLEGLEALKEDIEEALGVPREQQRLVRTREGVRVQLAADGAAPEAPAAAAAGGGLAGRLAGLLAGPVASVVRAGPQLGTHGWLVVQVRDLSGAEVATVTPAAHATVRQLRELLRRAAGVWPDEQHLHLYAEGCWRPLADGGATLSACGVRDGSAVRLVAGPGPLLFVRHWAGGRRRWEAVPARQRTPVAELRRELQRRTGVPPAQQALFLAGAALEEGRCVGHYGAEDGAALELLRLPGPRPATGTPSGELEAVRRSPGAALLWRALARALS